MSKSNFKCPYCDFEIDDAFTYGADGVLIEGDELQDIKCPSCLKIFDAVVNEIIARIECFIKEE